MARRQRILVRRTPIPTRNDLLALLRGRGHLLGLCIIRGSIGHGVTAL